MVGFFLPKNSHGSKGHNPAREIRTLIPRCKKYAKTKLQGSRSDSTTTIAMPATPLPSSFFILQPRFNLYFKPLFYSLSYQSSSPSLAFNCTGRFSICRPPFPSNTRLHCALSQATQAESPSDNASGGGRSGALSPGPLTGDVQKIDVNPPKGTRDFPPEDMRLRNWLFNNFKEVSRLHGFEEVDFPVLESEALFTRKAGEEIKDQVATMLF